MDAQTPQWIKDIEDPHLQKKVADLQEYADFKRDFAKFKQDFRSRKWLHPRTWRNWLQIGPLAVIIFIFSFYPELLGSRENQMRWLFGDDGTITLNHAAFFTLLLAPMFGLTAMVAFHRYRQWRKSRGE